MPIVSLADHRRRRRADSRQRRPADNDGTPAQQAPAYPVRHARRSRPTARLLGAQPFPRLRALLARTRREVDLYFEVVRELATSGCAARRAGAGAGHALRSEGPAAGGPPRPCPQLQRGERLGRRRLAAFLSERPGDEGPRHAGPHRLPSCRGRRQADRGRAASLRERPGAGARDPSEPAERLAPAFAGLPGGRLRHPARQ